MLPKYPDFKKLEIADLPVLKKILAQANPEICELSAANLLIWNGFDRPQCTCINKNPCILINPLNESPFFLEPLGHNLIQETIATCLNHTQKFSRIPAAFVKNFSSAKFKVKELPGHCDYVYTRTSLAELRGKPYDGKRNHIKKFHQHFPETQYFSITQKHAAAALALFEEWFAARAESRFFSRLAYTSQKKAIEKTFSLFDELNLTGGTIYTKEKMLGFIIGSRLNAETVAVHFSYGLRSAPGISQVLLQEVCRQTYGAYQYINLEQDLGIPGLRQAKLSYHPIKIEKKYELRLL